jgi:hypothetical protein
MLIQPVIGQVQNATQTYVFQVKMRLYVPMRSNADGKILNVSMLALQEVLILTVDLTLHVFGTLLRRNVMQIFVKTFL